MRSARARDSSISSGGARPISFHNKSSEFSSSEFMKDDETRFSFPRLDGDGVCCICNYEADSVPMYSESDGKTKLIRDTWIFYKKTRLKIVMKYRRENVYSNESKSANILKIVFYQY